MFGSNLLDAVIGLCLVYFLFSVLCSAVNEWVVGHLMKLRPKTLETAIKRMLLDAGAARDFFNQPLIKSLTQKEEAKPSYLCAATFVDALLALVKDNVKKNPHINCVSFFDQFLQICFCAKPLIYFQIVFNGIAVIRF